MTIRRIMFVDDEPHVLDGLRNLLRKYRHEWDMVFALGGKAALEELTSAPADVVVSDMCMPGMDGAELLTRVKEIFPGTARIILSGQAEREAIARMMPVAQQFLSKPCDVNVLRIAIERTCQFQALVGDDGIRRVAGALSKLPSLPEVYWELTRAISNPDSSISDVAKIVQKDLAISMKVLQLVNSAYFGLAQKIQSIDKAVAYLGMETVKALTITAHVFGSTTQDSLDGIRLDRLRDSAVITGRVAKQIVRDRKLADDAFTAGLLHDVGKLVLALDTSKRYGDVLKMARESGQALHVVEKRELGITHAAVGAHLLGIWGLPFSLAEAVAFHDTPGAVPGGNCDVLAAVHAADVLVDSPCYGKADHLEGDLDIAFLERAGVLGDLPMWRTVAAAEVARLAHAD